MRLNAVGATPCGCFKISREIESCSPGSLESHCRSGWQTATASEWSRRHAFQLGVLLHDQKSLKNRTGHVDENVLVLDIKQLIGALETLVDWQWFVLIR